MVKIFKAKSSPSLLGKTITFVIVRLDSNGKGVAQYKDKPVFIANTLVGEKVTAKVVEQKSKYIKAKLMSILTPSNYRVSPACKHFFQCGGCDLQHLDYPKQIIFKQDKISQLFARAGFDKLPWQAPIASKAWYYRRKARVGVQYNKLGVPIVGFRHQGTNVLTAIKSCSVLIEALSAIFPVLNNILTEIKQPQSVGHIEIIAVDSINIVIRQLIPLSDKAQAIWLKYAEQYGWQLWLDDGDQVTALTENKALYYRLLDETDISFAPRDFIQVNHEVNLKMVNQAMQWLALSADDTVLDLFCGLGNFSLVMARYASTVIGVEGVKVMTEKARDNAEKNNLSNCAFYHADLNSTWQKQPWTNQKYSVVVLDPARAGAYQACQQLVKLSPKKILYVSCEPNSLAKDASVLKGAGYQLKKIALMDMFSQTKHVETMVLFER